MDRIVTDMLHSLADLARLHKTHKLDHCQHYVRHVDIDNGPFTLLEIGVGGGGSLRMWRDWFGYADVIGIDIEPSTMIEESGLTTWLGDAANPEFWADHPLPHNLRVIIDDGSHRASDIVATFEILWDELRKEGWYVIEDLGAQFCDEWEGSEDGSAATRLIDELLRRAQRGHGVSEFHAYRGIVFIKKA
jgi:hypothetical protein